MVDCPGEAVPCLAPPPLPASLPKGSLLVSSPDIWFLFKKHQSTLFSTHVHKAVRVSDGRRRVHAENSTELLLKGEEWINLAKPRNFFKLNLEFFSEIQWEMGFCGSLPLRLFITASALSKALDALSRYDEPVCCELAKSQWRFANTSVQRFWPIYIL